MNFIHHVANAYPKKSCEKLIEWFEQNIDNAKPGFAGNKNLKDLEINLEVNSLSDYFDLGYCLYNSIKNFIDKYPLLNKHIHKWSLDTVCQLMKYEPNNFYSEIHCENDGDKRNLKRVFAWMIFLNTIDEGGGTKFIFQNYIAKPQSGSFYIWPSGWTHLHQGIPATKKNKYIITGWVSYE